MYHFRCKECDVEFTSSRKGRIFCGDKCSRIARRLKEKKTIKFCPTCNQNKSVELFYISRDKSDGRHFQCKQCANEKIRNKPEEWKQKEKIRHRIKARKKLGLSTDLSISYKRKRNLESWITITKPGYVVIGRPTHPNARKNGLIFQHVWIMSEHLGRPLNKGETVHHINGIRHDNRIENLELWHRGQPAGQRVEDKIRWCKEFLDQYGYDVLKR